MSKVLCIVQARMGSTRLPGKVLKIVEGKSLLEHLIDRLKYAKRINKIVIATTVNRKDDAIVDLCKRIKIDWFRGSEEDVLDRYYQCARKYKAKIIIRVTSDCPVIDPEIIDKMIDCYFKNKDEVDYLSNVIPVRTYPLGLDVEIFSFSSLKRAWKEAKKQPDREHVTPYIYMHPKNFKIYNFKDRKNYSKYRWTVDTQEDLNLIKEIYSHLYKPDRIFLYRDILKLFEENPTLANINKNVKQKEYGE